MDDAKLASLIGANIRAARIAADMTLQQLSDATGLHVPQLSRIERGETGGPKVVTLRKIADALGVKVCALIDPPAPAPAKKGRRT